MKLDNHLSQAKKKCLRHYARRSNNRHNICLGAAPVFRSLVSRIPTFDKYSANFLKIIQLNEKFHLNVGFTDGKSFIFKTRVKTLKFSFHISILFYEYIKFVILIQTIYMGACGSVVG